MNTYLWGIGVMSCDVDWGEEKLAYIDDKHMIPAHEVRKRDRFDPLLVSLHDNARNYIKAKDDQNAVQGLIDAVVALLDAQLQLNERILASEVLISLVNQAERNMRESLSAKLAARNDVPETLLHYLLYDDIDMAGAILRQSRQLSEQDLSYIIHSKEKDHWNAIAARDDLTDRLVSQLVSKQDADTMITLLKNEGIVIAEDILREFYPMVKTDENVATEFVNYKALPKTIAVEIYWHVSAVLRQTIVARFEMSAVDIDMMMQDCLQDFTDTMNDLKDMTPSPLMQEVADIYMARDRITDDLLVSALRRRQGRFFIALFARKTGLSFSVVHSLMKQVAGQGLAVACRACNIGRSPFMSMFLIGRAIAKPDQAVNAEELKMALRYYDGLTLKMAQDILNQSIGR